MKSTISRSVLAAFLLTFAAVGVQAKSPSLPGLNDGAKAESPKDSHDKGNKTKVTVGKDLDSIEISDEKHGTLKVENLSGKDKDKKDKK